MLAGGRVSAGEYPRLWVSNPGFHTVDEQLLIFFAMHSIKTH